MSTTANTIETREALLARLTTAAYQVALRHGVKGSSIDLELTMWRALRSEMCWTNVAGGVEAKLHEGTAVWGA